MRPLPVILICLFCSALAEAGIFGPLTMGMTHGQAQQALSTYDKVVPPKQDTVMGSENLTHLAFTTKEPYGGAICQLYMGFNQKGLNAITLISTEAFTPEEYPNEFRSRYKQLAVMQQQIYGEPVSVGSWPSSAMLQENRQTFLHYFKASAELMICTGIMKNENYDFVVVTRYLAVGDNPPQYPPVKEETKKYWEGVPEFYNLIKADEWILKAIDAVYAKNAKEAMACFQEAAELGSARGYWGLSFLYSGAIKGVSANKKLHDEYRNKAAGMGYALSAVEVDRNFDTAMTKLNISPKDARLMLGRLHRAAKEGRFSEQYNLGIMYKNGFGVTKNLKRAKAYFESAAQQGDKQAASALEALEAADKQ